MGENSVSTDNVMTPNEVEDKDVSGDDGSFDAAIAEFKAQNEQAQQRNLEMMGIQVEEGTALKAAGQQVNPK